MPGYAGAAQRYFGVILPMTVFTAALSPLALAAVRGVWRRMTPGGLAHGSKSVFRRVGGLIVITVLVLVGFVLRLVQFQLVQGEDLLAEAQKVTNYKLRITAARGDIVDQYGRSPATNARAITWR